MKLILGLMCLMPCIAFADSGVLIEHVPGGADPGVVVAVMRQALINRGWKIEAVDATSVSASIKGSTAANIRIILSQGRLLFEGDAVRTYKPSQQGPPMHVSEGIPKNWLAYLRREIGTSLALIPERSDK